METLKYKDYEGSAELDMTRGVCRGKILCIEDLVTYESKLPANLQKEFQAAVDDYIETCAALGREAQKPFKGVFNVRVSPTLHKAAVQRAIAENVKLNDVVVRALDAFLNAHVDVNNHVETRNYYITEGVLQDFIATASDKSNQQFVYEESVTATGGITAVQTINIVPGKKVIKDASTRH